MFCVSALKHQVVEAESRPVRHGEYPSVTSNVSINGGAFVVVVGQHAANARNAYPIDGHFLLIGYLDSLKNGSACIPRDVKRSSSSASQHVGNVLDIGC